MISADPGIDQVSVYEMNQRTGELHLVDAVRVKLESSPCFLTFSKDGRFLYVLSEQANSIDVYAYSDHDGDERRSLCFLRKYRREYCHDVFPRC